MEHFHYNTSDEETRKIIAEGNERLVGRYFTAKRSGGKGVIVGVSGFNKRSNGINYNCNVIFEDDRFRDTNVYHNYDYVYIVQNNKLYYTTVYNARTITSELITISDKVYKAPKSAKEKFEFVTDMLVTKNGNIYPAPLMVSLKFKTCSCCKKSQPSDALQKIGSKYICRECYSVKGYSTANNTRIKAPTKKGFTYGYELESVVKHRNNESLDNGTASVVSLGYNIIPTADGSLPAYGVEFKTPIMQSLKGTTTMLKKMSNYVSFTHNACGQHINIGNTNFYNEASAAKLRAFSKYIFNPLGEYLKDNPLITKKVCGRNFTGYASYKGIYNIYTDHCSWINLSENNRVEFRISKVRTPEQYVALTKLWADILTCINNNFFLKYGNSYSANKILAKRCGEKVRKLFEKRASKF